MGEGNKYLPAKSSHLSLQGDGQVATQHTYVTEGDINLCLLYGFFDSIRNQLLPCDSIKIIQIQGKYTDIKNAIVIAKRFVDIVAIKDNHVDFRPADERTFYYTDLKKSPEEEKKVDYEVKWNVGTGSYKVLKDGEIISEVWERSEAEAIKKGEMEPPSKEEVKVMRKRREELKNNPSAKEEETEDAFS